MYLLFLFLTRNPNPIGVIATGGFNLSLFHLEIKQNTFLSHLTQDTVSETSDMEPPAPFLQESAAVCYAGLMFLDNPSWCWDNRFDHHLPLCPNGCFRVRPKGLDPCWWESGKIQRNVACFGEITSSGNFHHKGINLYHIVDYSKGKQSKGKQRAYILILLEGQWGYF